MPKLRQIGLDPAVQGVPVKKKLYLLVIAKRSSKKNTADALQCMLSISERIRTTRVFIRALN